MRYSAIINSNFDKERLTQTMSFNQRETEAVPSIDFFNNIQEESIPRETLVSVYGDNYDSIQTNLQNIEIETINYFSNTTNQLSNKYKEFNKNINFHFKTVTDKITNAFKLNDPKEDIKNTQRNSIIQKYSKEYLEQLNKIIKMHEQILRNIKDSISIFFNFLDISKYLDNEKPIQDFINKEFKNIIQNWLFLKINLENIDFAQKIKDSPIEPDFKNFIFKVCKNKNFVMNVSLPREHMINSRKNLENLEPKLQNMINSKIEKTRIIMAENNSNLIKVKMNNIFNADQYFDKNVKYERLRYMKFDNVTFKQDRNNIENNFLENSPNLEKLIINSSNKFEINLLKNISKSLIKLSLTKNGLVDYEFNNIMTNYLANSDSIRNYLQILSFSNNNLTNIELSPKRNFHALKELNFEKNKIYKFDISSEKFPELKCINCCSNCFTRSYFAQNPNIIALLSGNIFLSDINLAKNYFSTLQKQLNNSVISLSYLNLSYIPKILSNDYLSNLIINESILINLKQLDLSHNYIQCNSLFKFLGNNKGCLSLKSLNLSYNKLDDSFFEKFLDLKLNNLFTKLKHIYLDSNKFGTYNKKDGSTKKMSAILFQDNNSKEKDIYRIRLLYRFIAENKNLVELTITKNPIKNKYVLKSINDYEGEFKSKNFVKYDENNSLEINCFYSLFLKIKQELIGNKNDLKESRPSFFLKFDLENSINITSENFDYIGKYIIYNNAINIGMN